MEEEPKRSPIYIASPFGLATIIACLLVLLLWIAGYLFHLGLWVHSGKTITMINNSAALWSLYIDWKQYIPTSEGIRIKSRPRFYTTREKEPYGVGRHLSSNTQGPCLKAMFSLRGFQSTYLQSLPRSVSLYVQCPSSLGFYLSIIIIAVCFPFTFRRTSPHE